jgi:Flp pilus assembly protein CpaB
MNLWEQLRRHDGDQNGNADADALIELPPPHADEIRVRPRASEEQPRLNARKRRHPLAQPLPLIGMLLVLVALAGYLAVYGQAGKRSAVLIVARPLPAGSVVRAGDVRVGKLAADRATLSAHVPAADLGATVGRSVRVGLVPGTPLSLAALAAAGRRPAAFTLVVPALHALGGGLQAGDRVSVLATFDNGGGQAQTRVLARNLEVLDVGAAPAGLDQTAATIPVTVALPDPSLASALALANSAAKIDLLRDGAGTSAAAIPTVSSAQP